MGFISSLFKYRKLRRISKELGSPFDVATFMHELGSKGQSRRDRALKQLLDLCESDSTLSQIMRSRGAGRERLQEVYWVLLSIRAGQWVGGHYVPVSALASPFTLDFLLEQAGRLPWNHIAVLLVEYFERNESGPVPLHLRGPVDPNDPLNALWRLTQQQKRRD